MRLTEAEGDVSLYKGKKGKSLGTFHIKVTNSDVTDLAGLVMNKLVADAASFGKMFRNRNVVSYVRQGKDMIGSQLDQTIATAVAGMEPFVELVDKIARVSKIVSLQVVI